MACHFYAALVKSVYTNDNKLAVPVGYNFNCTNIFLEISEPLAPSHCFRDRSQMRSSLGGGLEMMTSLYFPILFVKNFSQFDDMRGRGGVKNPKILMRSFVNGPLVH